MSIYRGLFIKIGIPTYKTSYIGTSIHTALIYINDIYISGSLLTPHTSKFNVGPAIL